MQGDHIVCRRCTSAWGQGENTQFPSSGGREGNKFVVQIKDFFLALLWAWREELFLFHSVPFHISAARSSRSEGQIKLHFHFIFIEWDVRRQEVAPFLGERKIFPTLSSSLWIAKILKMVQERHGNTFVNSSHWFSQSQPLSWWQCINPDLCHISVSCVWGRKLEGKTKTKLFLASRLVSQSWTACVSRLFRLDLCCCCCHSEIQWWFNSRPDLRINHSLVANGSEEL